MIFPLKINESVYKFSIDATSKLDITLPVDRLGDLSFKDFEALESILTKEHAKYFEPILKKAVMKYLNKIGLDLGDLPEYGRNTIIKLKAKK